MSNGIAMAAVIGTREVMLAAQDTFISTTYHTERLGPAAALVRCNRHELFVPFHFSTRRTQHTHPHIQDHILNPALQSCGVSISKLINQIDLLILKQMHLQATAEHQTLTVGRIGSTWTGHHQKVHQGGRAGRPAPEHTACLGSVPPRPCGAPGCEVAHTQAAAVGAQAVNTRLGLTVKEGMTAAAGRAGLPIALAGMDCWCAGARPERLRRAPPPPPPPHTQCSCAALVRLCPSFKHRRCQTHRGCSSSVCVVSRPSFSFEGWAKPHAAELTTLFTQVKLHDMCDQQTAVQKCAWVWVCGGHC